MVRRMFKANLILCLVILVKAFFCFFSISYAQELKTSDLNINISSNVDLIRQATQFNEKIVRIKGEVIGDLMQRQDSVWLNVQDQTQAIGILSSKEMTREIKRGGDYTFKGNVIEVEGKFFQSDPQQGGECYILAHKILVLEKETPIYHAVPIAKIEISALLFLGIVSLSFLRKRIQQRTA